MQQHNISNKKAVAHAALKERTVIATAWLFIILCAYIVLQLSQIGLKNLFLISNKHFTLQNIDLQAEALPANTAGLINQKELENQLQLHRGSDSLFDINLEDLYQKITSNICVEDASISYIFPDTLKIRYVEKDPAARLKDRKLIARPKASTNELTEALLLPAGRYDLTLPVIMENNSHNPGSSTKDKKITTPLKFLQFNENCTVNYPIAKSVLGKTAFCSAELLKVKTISLSSTDTLNIILHGNEQLMLADNSRLKIPVENFEIGIRRACIALIQNANARKITRKIDARYSNTPTE